MKWIGRSLRWTARRVLALMLLTTSLSMGLRTEMNRPSWRAGAWAEADGPERISTAIRAAATARQAELANPTANRAAATMHSPRPSLPMSPHSLYLIINEPEPKSKHTRRVASLVL